MYDDDTSIANLIIAEAGIQINIRAWGGGGGGGGLYSHSRYYDVFILHHSVLHHRDMDALLDELMI